MAKSSPQAKRRRPIPKKSAAQIRRDRLYAPLAEWFKAKNPVCRCCARLRPHAAPLLTQDIHHAHGKIGALFFFFPWFVAVCRSCHDWIERNKEEARRLGFECEHGKFNTQSEESVYVVKWREGRKLHREYIAINPALADTVGEVFRVHHPSTPYEIALVE
jgi:hypothetical protein